MKKIIDMHCAMCNSTSMKTKTRRKSYHFSISETGTCMDGSFISTIANSFDEALESARETMRKSINNQVHNAKLTFVKAGGRFSPIEMEAHLNND